MAYRIVIKGMEIYCDTPQEVFALAKGKGLRGRDGRQHKTQVPLFQKSGKLLLEALKEAFPDGLTSERLAQRMGVSPKSLPPIFVSLRSRARKNGMEMEDIVRREKGFEKGKPLSTYRITEKGIQALNKQLEKGV